MGRPGEGVDKLLRIPRDEAPNAAWGGAGMGLEVFQVEAKAKRDEQREGGGGRLSRRKE